MIILNWVEFLGICIYNFHFLFSHCYSYSFKNMFSLSISLCLIIMMVWCPLASLAEICLLSAIEGFRSDQI